MRIHFVSQADSYLASHRMRVEKPVELLNQRGHTATWSDEADASVDINVFQKHMNPSYTSTMANILKGTTKIAFDISDDHFDKTNGAHYLQMMKMADIITCNGPSLIKKAEQYADGKKIYYVKDPITFPPHSPILNFEKPKLVWYGHISNFGTVNALADTLEDPLTVITNKEVVGKFEYVEWEPGKVESLIHKFDIVILPLKGNETKYTKNNNRAVDALESGRFVITDSPEVYGSLKDYIYIGDIKQGIKWFKENPREALRMILLGQDVVRHTYNDLVIADMWEIALTGEISRKRTEVA